MAPKNNDDKVFDISKPGKSQPAATSKPVIVGHKSMVEDPMVVAANKPEATTPAPVAVEPEDKPAGSPVVEEKGSIDEASHTAKVVTPPSDAAPAAEGDNEKPGETEAKPPEEKLAEEAVADSVPDEKDDNKEVKPADSKETEAEKAKAAAIQELIENKKYAVKIGEVQRKRHSHWTLAILVLLLVAIFTAYLLIDAGIIKTNIKLPYHIFKNTNSLFK